MKPSILQSISTQLNHPFVQLVSRGNSAILLSILKCSGKVFSPTEGGWLTYKQYAKDLGKEYVEVNTKYAKINLDDLKEKISTAPRKSIFLYHSLAGYCAQQDIKLIYEICQEYGVLVVMDCSGSFGTSFANGQFADICFASFGKWKLVDFGKGGFISCKDEALYKEYKSLFSSVTLVLNTEEESALLHKLDSVQERIEFLNAERKNIIEFFSREGIKILHKESSVGFVVIALHKSELEKFKIIGYCTRNGYEYTECPREIRVLENAISIEVKRLEIPKHI